MKVLFASTNPSKVLRYKQLLEERGIELITIRDLDFKLDLEESGKDAIENAHIKAEAYYAATKLPTIGMDDNLFIEGLPEEKQPGTHVRRVNGKELTDEEMIEYYTDLVRENGGKLIAKWGYGMVICKENNTYEYSWYMEHFYLVDHPCEKRNPGYPLNSITFVPEFNKYLVELTDEEKAEYRKKDNTEKVIEFIMNSLEN